MQKLPFKPLTATTQKKTPETLCCLHNYKKCVILIVIIKINLLFYQPLNSISCQLSTCLYNSPDKIFTGVTADREESPCVRVCQHWVQEVGHLCPGGHSECSRRPADGYPWQAHPLPCKRCPQEHRRRSGNSREPRLVRQQNQGQCWCGSPGKVWVGQGCPSNPWGSTVTENSEHSKNVLPCKGKRLFGNHSFLNTIHEIIKCTRNFHYC